MNEHILLTGGTGFFGKSILRYLLNQFINGFTKFQVTVLTRSPESFLNSYPEFSKLSWLSFHVGDIMIFDSLPHGSEFTKIIHAAADSTFGPSLSPLQRYRQIVDGTQNILDFSVKNNVEKFLYISSGAVYGAQPHYMNSIPEDWHGMPDPLNPANAYGVAKRAAEHLCALYHDAYGLHTIIARCFAFVGQDLPLNVHFAIGNFINDALYQKEITVKGDGSPIRSYLDQADLALVLMLLLEKGAANQAYNVGSNEPISIAKLAVQIRDILSPLKNIKFGHRSNDNSARNAYIPNIDKLEKLAQFKINNNIINSIQKFIP
jgi:UDP-glucuronate decarboxylase